MTAPVSPEDAPASEPKAAAGGLPRLVSAARTCLREAARISFELYKIMIPVLIVVKILQEAGLIPLLARPLAPLMELVGLPGVYGLVWATAILNSIYAGMIVLPSVMLEAPLSVAQMSVLAVLMLLAHNLPLELQITRRAGARLPFQLLLRMAGALLLGIILHQIYSRLGVLGEPARLLLSPEAESQTLLAWSVSQVRNLVLIFGIILTLISLMRLLSFLGVTRLMDAVLGPVLRFMGIGAKASTITVIGLTMGLSYGGGLIIGEAKSGRVGPADVFAGVSLMSLCHSLIEDTLLMLVIGGHVSGVIWGRLFFSMLLTALIVRLARLAGPAFASRYLWTSV